MAEDKEDENSEVNYYNMGSSGESEDSDKTEEDEEPKESTESEESEGSFERTIIIILISVIVILILGLGGFFGYMFASGGFEDTGVNETSQEGSQGGSQGGKNQNGSQDTGKNQTDFNLSKNMTFEEKLKNCLQKEGFGSECSRLFTDPNIGTYCESIMEENSELGNDCFYEGAISKRRERLCENIKNSELKNKCLEKSAPIVMEDENEV